jgi:hypothetical protein
VTGRESEGFALLGFKALMGYWASRNFFLLINSWLYPKMWLFISSKNLKKISSKKERSFVFHEYQQFQNLKKFMCNG